MSSAADVLWRLGITSTCKGSRRRSSHLSSCMFLVPWTVDILVDLFSGHVRATTAGTLSLDNCHPFQFGKFMVRPLDVLARNRFADREPVHAQRWHCRVPQDQAATAVLLVGRNLRYGHRKHRYECLRFSMDTRPYPEYLPDSQWSFALFLSKVGSNATPQRLRGSDYIDSFLICMPTATLRRCYRKLC